MKSKVLHLTNTSIKYDNRIIKELNSINEIPNIDLYSIGIDFYEGLPYSDYTSKLNIFQIKPILPSLRKNIRFVYNVLNFFRITLTFLKLGNQFKPNVIHCHDFVVLFVGCLLKIKNKSILIYDAHELESNKSGQNKAVRNLIYLYEKMLWKKIDYFISVSNSIIEWYNREYGKKESILILNSPVYKKTSIEKNNNYNYLRDLFNIPKDVKIFIYVGLLDKERFVENIISVFCENDILSHVVFLGYGDLASCIKKSSLSNSKIHFMDPVKHEKVVSVVTDADVGFCLIGKENLSNYFSLPNKFFEYAFSNIYILSSKNPDIVYFVDKYKLGRAIDTDFQAIKQVVKEVENNFEILKPNLDLYELSWDYQRAKLKSLYIKMLDL